VNAVHPSTASSTSEDNPPGEPQVTTRKPSSPLETAESTSGTSETLMHESADVHASSDDYAARFQGEIGEWMLKIQEEALLSLLDTDTQTVLDIGGGHGQTALPLSSAQKSVTVLGSAPVCGERLTSYISNGIISFNVGNLLHAPYQNSSFDTVVSFRLMSHSVAWKSLVGEMARLAHHSVIIDYPTWISVNFLSPLLFSIKRRIEGNTRTFKLFSGLDLQAEFKRHGFIKERAIKQFFFPMALHRRINSVRISAALERCASLCGLTRLFGSPIIVKFVRK
jgi:2-polyprenyl-3-methyl-5-hydroxy-6-metoxy-1,4-benzoquinol methylase